MNSHRNKHHSNLLKRRGFFQNTESSLAKEEAQIRKNGLAKGYFQHQKIHPIHHYFYRKATYF